MQGDFITLRKVKSKLLKLRLKDKDDGDEAEDLPEDSDKESYHTRIKQKLIALREKLGEEIKEDRELARVKIKQKIIKLTEKLLKEKDEEMNGREESVMDGSEECSEEEEGEGEGEENETEGEGGVRKSMSVALMNKICKLTEKLGKYDDRCSKVEQPSEGIGEKEKTESTPQQQEEKEEGGGGQETTPSDGEGKSIKIKKKLLKMVDEFEEKKTRKGKVKIICDLLRIDDGGEDKDSLCSEDEKEGIGLKKMKKLLVKNEKMNCESSDTERNEPENPTGSRGQSKVETTELCSSEMKILEKLSQRFKERSDKVQRYFQRSGKLAEVNRRLKSQIWSSVVTIVLVEGKNLVQGDNERTCDSYCKFRLGNEKYKSKVVYKNPSPSWLDQFDFHLYDDQAQELEVTVWHKEKPRDEFLGRCVIDLTLLEREKTHGIWQNLEEGGGSIHLLLTISGTTASETISDLSSYDENPAEREKIERRYALKNTLHNLRDVGHLTVKVFRATGLAAADLGGKSDPFCVLELVNARLQTQTEYKTLSPSWQKIFTFNVKDINAVLEVTVFDEDRDHKVEFLGKVAIPLLRIKNGEKKWYCLKDKKLQGRAKGNCPMILLEMRVVWNPVRACIRSLNPKEEKYMQAEMKFKRQVFIRNVVRLKGIIMVIFNWGKQIQDLFEWERPAQSAMALVFFIVLCYYFEPYMIPMGFLLVFFKYYLVMWLTGGKSTGGGSVSSGVSGISGTSSVSGASACASGCGGSSTGDDEEELSAAEEEEDDDEKDKLTLQEEKKSLKERLQAIQDVTQTVQNSIGYMASLGEQVKNTFNFTVPFISYLAIALSVGAVIIMYFIPLRYLIMIAGVNKFARKLLRPHTIPNNEVLDLLSRVPDDVDLVSYREFRPYTSTELEKRRELRKKLKMG